jgi:hypothetical protein
MPTTDEQTTDAIDNGTIDTTDGRNVIKAALAKIAAKQNRIKTYNDYYFGNHPFNFSSEKFTTKFAQRLRKFRDNLCPTVVKAPTDRLEVIGFSSDQASDLYKTTWAAWIHSGMPRLAKRIHRDAFRTGDGFATVWRDETGRSRIYPQDVRNCTVFYNAETGNVDIGAKLWRGNDRNVYLTLFFADRLEKYVTKNPQAEGNIPSTAGAFKKRIIPGEPWPLPNPIGECSMFHFGNETSILDDVIPLNDALNKTIADMLVSSESNSLRQRWSTGIAYEVNPESGKQIIPFETVSQWFAASDPTAKFGQFTDANLKDFGAVAEFFVDQISSVSGIPKYYFKLEGGSMPSGEALRKAESRFTSLIKDAQLEFGETWSRVMSFAMKLDGETAPETASSAAGEPTTHKLEAQWTPADPMSSNEAVDLAIKKKTVGVSTTRALSELGYTDADITAMQKENSDAAKTQAENFSKTFNAGPQLG